MGIKTKQVIENKEFIARRVERVTLRRIAESGESAIVVVHGRRRVGKTELLEQSFRERNILKFEGLENKTQAEQRQHVLIELSKYVQDPLIANLNYDRWVEVFELIGRYVKEGVWTVYFEEVQWLADYCDDFASELKYVWDNTFRYNQNLVLILCGSSPSFMIRKIVQSRALYNRSMYEIPLSEFNLIEAQGLLPKLSPAEMLDAYLIVGGIPEYLTKLRHSSSVLLSVCEQSFVPGGFLFSEFQKIFVSSLANNEHYRDIIEFLSKNRYATRNTIAKAIRIKPGGSLTELLADLECCGFIEKYTPYNTSPETNLIRYCIRDHYLNFYFKFIKPVRHEIQRGDYHTKPSTAIKHESYRRWLGFAFERFCRRNHRIIANILGFSAVRYRSGAFYNRATIASETGFQIDLIYERDDQVLTLCEAKLTQQPISKDIIPDFEHKLNQVQNKKNKTIHKVLITANGASESLINTGYFDDIITLKELFCEHYWR